ncbi:MAG: UvrD-helicase domain-containing protein [Anaerolineae bacterium]|nr:UvrD-helicase domain-containing protein [Anaerolineae bacterium]
MKREALDRILAPLDAEQREVVLHGSGPLLVVAGPGSGKTRAITHRIAYLLATGQATPQQVLALAFTNKAAEEMQARLLDLVGEEARDVWISTFHALCLRLLREHGREIGLPDHFVVFDEMAQEEALAAALGQAGWYRYSTQYELEQLRALLTWQKSQYPPRDPAPEEEAWAAIAARYQEILASFNALDFDDLILRAVELLTTVPEVRQAVQGRWPFVFVDEYHDISPSQYALLNLLAPPPGASCMAVADKDQSIYGWRGGAPGLVERFRREYRARVLHLRRNYRSAPNIVAVTQALISKMEGREPRPSALVEGPKTEHPVVHHLFARQEQEAAWVVETIQRLLQEGRAPKNVAVLYRTHRRGDPLEQALAQAHIPFQRVRRRGLFQRAGSEEILRHLQLLQHFADPYFRAALTFPRVIADELTMLQLQRIAQREGITLVELARTIHQYPEVSPLTRAAIKEFVQTYAALRQRAPGATAPAVVRRLFEVLEHWRSPYREEDRETLAGFVAFLHMREEAAQACRALDAGRPVRLMASDAPGPVLGGFLLQDVLRSYLGVEAELQASAVGERGGPALLIQFGADGEAGASPFPPIALRPRQAGQAQYGIALQAWRLAQALLASFETLDQERFVVYDLETTGPSPYYDDMVEIGAVTLDRGQQVGAPFHSLVRPSRRISREAQKVHGISQEDVRDAPPVDVVLRRFLAYVGDATLAGHNVARFDNAILDREIGKVLRRGLTLPTLDTLEMAARLLPRSRHSLQALLDHFGLPREEAHRALADAEAAADLMLALFAENRQQKEMESLTEYLPLVMAAEAASGHPTGSEEEMLREAARRVVRRPRARAVAQRLSTALPEALWFPVSRHLAGLERERPSPSVGDYQWESLRQEWQERAERFASLSQDASLEGFLDYLATATSEDTWDPKADAVTLMTLHNAKGKEFPVVIIVGVEEGEIPYWTARDAERLAEERRVLYVGMTRAREALYLSSVREAGNRRRNPSRFLSGIPSRLMQRRYHYD